MRRFTFILITIVFLSGCSNSLPKAPELPKLPKFSMPELPKMPKLSLPSWAKPKMPSIETYKPSISQGSVLNIEDVNKLRLGINKTDVINLIGSPSISDPFHQYQWDYINYSTNDRGEKIYYRLRLVFSGNTLSEIDKSELEQLINK
jgi:outer membrane protein assembly factor BamE|tara:strand:- start:392 stop:832 length:441 start_codon:yes stop_codon:yes gene_type:complete